MHMKYLSFKWPFFEPILCFCRNNNNNNLIVKEENINECNNKLKQRNAKCENDKTFMAYQPKSEQIYIYILKHLHNAH